MACTTGTVWTGEKLRTTNKHNQDICASLKTTCTKNLHYNKLYMLLSLDFQNLFITERGIYFLWWNGKHFGLYFYYVVGTQVKVCWENKKCCVFMGQQATVSKALFEFFPNFHKCSIINAIKNNVNKMFFYLLCCHNNVSVFLLSYLFILFKKNNTSPLGLFIVQCYGIMEIPVHVLVLKLSNECIFPFGYFVIWIATKVSCLLLFYMSQQFTW